MNIQKYPYRTTVTILVICSIFIYAIVSSEKENLISDFGLNATKNTKVNLSPGTSNIVLQRANSANNSKAINYLEMEKPETSAISVVQLNKALENSKEWLAGRGYFLMEDFIENPELSGNDSPTNEYNGYSLEQLRMLAENQDPIGQMYYGFRLLPIDLEEGENWLKASIVHGNYTSVISNVLDAYQQKLDSLRFNEHQVRNKSNNTQPNASSLQQEIKTVQDKIYVWGLLSGLLDDPFSHKSVSHLYASDEFSEKRVLANNNSAQSLFEELSNRRSALGLDDFSQEQIDENDFSVLFFY